MDKYQSKYGGNLQTEASFKNNLPANYGTKGSTRLDVFDPVTGKVYDYKFVKNPGNGISNKQQVKNRTQGPLNIKKIIEINP